MNKVAVFFVSFLLTAAAAEAQDGANGNAADPKPAAVAEPAVQEEISQEGEEPAEAPAPKKKKRPDEPVRFGAKAWTLLGYDDNIVNLNNLQQSEFRAGVDPERFRIKSVDDFVATAAAEADVRLDWLESAGPTELGGRAEAHFYEKNSFVNYEEYRIWLGQPLGGSDRLRATASFTPERYKRELRNPVTAQFQSAFHDEFEYKGAWRHSVSPVVDAEPFGGWRIDDYDAPFTFRDLQGWFGGVKLTARPADIVEIGVTYEFSQMDADVGPAQPDFSYRQNLIEPAVRLKPLDDLDLSVCWRVEIRDFTTKTDLEHLGREDIKQRGIAAAAWRLSKGLEATAEYRFYDVTSNRPNDNVTADETAYMRNVVLVGIAWRY